MEETIKNPLGYEKVGKLIRKFAIPSVIALLVSACYNLVDQLFIGNVIGELGNAATNIVFPLTNLCLALGLMFGSGGAAAFNLRLGAGDEKTAPYYFGNAVTLMLLSGVVVGALTEIFMYPMLDLFGSPASVVPYAAEYARIIAIGFPVYILSFGGGHLLRADGRPNLTMVCNAVGAVINIGLDALFILVFGWGMAGAAWATIIGQFIAGVITIWFLINTKTIKVKFANFVPRLIYFGKDAVLGLGSACNQVSLMIVQIVLNNSLRFYGGASIFGEEIPIACAGIISKTGTIFSSFVIGISQGYQPIASFNYGAQNYERVKESYYRALLNAFIAAAITFIVFQVFPRQILSLFGEGSELYFEFGCRWFRIYFFMVGLFFIQLISSHLFLSIGKPWKGMFLSLTRQIIYYLPLILIMPRFFGIDGILYAQPLADFLAISTAVVMVIIEFQNPGFKEAKGVFWGILKGKYK